MRILLAGTPSIALPIFDAILASDHQLVGVITNPPKSRGRSGSLVPSPVSGWGREHLLPVFESGSDSEYEKLLPTIDLVLVVAYGRLIPRSLLRIPRHGWVNIHFSHLPEARGAAPVQRLIESGATQIGYTLFQLDEGMDTGPIFYRSPLLEIEGMTTGEVWTALAHQAAGGIVAQIREIGTGKEALPQSTYSGPVAHAPKITNEESRITWFDSATVVARKVRAFNPTPTAWSTFRGERFLIHRAQATAPQTSQPVTLGRIFINQAQVLVHCAGSALRLIEVQPAGKRAMSAEEWARGAQLEIESHFE